MRKIEKEMLNAIKYKYPFSKGNTVFHRAVNSDNRGRSTHAWELVLHGNPIALFDEGSKHYPIPTYVSLAGWQTKTTCSRLNALDGVSVKIRKGVPYLNGREIEADGWWSPGNLHENNL